MSLSTKDSEENQYCAFSPEETEDLMQYLSQLLY